MFYLVDKTEDLTLGHNISDNSEGCSQEAARREPGYAEVFATKTLSSGNIKGSVQFNSV